MTINLEITNKKRYSELREVEQKEGLVNIFMRDIEQRSRMSEKNLSMTTTLVKYLNFDGMTKYGNCILLGRVVGIYDIEPYTRRYLHQIASIKFSLPD